MPYDIIIGRDESDKKKFEKKGLIFLGKGYVTMGQYTSLSNPIYMDIARSHVVLISGKRGSGKSYTMGVVAEELATLPTEEKKNIAGLIFDTIGIYWTMKYENDKEKELLESWNLKPSKTPVQIFIPYGYSEEFEKRGLPADSLFSINPSELEAEDWILTFNLEFTNPVSILIEKVISSLKEKIIYSIQDIIHEINQDKSTSIETRNSASGLFQAANSWKVFSQETTKISDLVQAGKTAVLDLSMYSSVSAFNVRALVIGLISKKLFNQRTLARKKEEIQAVQHGEDYLSFKQEREMPLVWIFIDEVHEFLPETGKTPASDALIQLLREGRQP